MLAKHKMFRDYWVQKGGSTSWLLKFINKDSNFKNFLDRQQVSLHSFGKTDIAQLQSSDALNSSILFQVGYLTIVTYNKKEASITLEPPNKEIRQSFASDLWSSFSATNDTDAFNKLQKLSNDLQNSSIMKFWDDFNVILSIPHFAGKYNLLFIWLCILLEFCFEVKIQVAQEGQTCGLRQQLMFSLLNSKNLMQRNITQ